MAKTAVASLDFYRRMPIEGQLALSYAAGGVPASATPPEIVSAGVSWGLILTNGEALSFTRLGDDLLHMVITEKELIAEAQDAQARELAGNALGAYLDEVAISFDPLPTEEQWLKILRVVTSAYLFNRLKAIAK